VQQVREPVAALAPVGDCPEGPGNCEGTVSEPIEKITLHVPRSEDGETEFARVADILDHLATMYAYNDYIYGFLVTRANDARQIDKVMAGCKVMPCG